MLCISYNKPVLFQKTVLMLSQSGHMAQKERNYLFCKTMFCFAHSKLHFHCDWLYKYLCTDWHTPTHAVEIVYQNSSQSCNVQCAPIFFHLIWFDFTDYNLLNWFYEPLVQSLQNTSEACPKYNLIFTVTLWILVLSKHS